MSKLDQAALQILLDERDIRKLYLRYARGVDRLDAELLRDCFHEDAVITTSRAELRDDFVHNIMIGLSNFKITQHLTSNIWVEVEGSTAEGEAMLMQTTALLVKMVKWTRTIAGAVGMSIDSSNAMMNGALSVA